MLYALGFIGLFLIGGLTGLFLASLGVDVHVTDTYFVVAHFHYVMVGSVLMAYLGGMHYWWPKISGRMYPEGWGRSGCINRIHRLQSHIFPAVHVWATSGCRAATGSTSSEYPGAEYLLYCGCDHPGRGIRSSPDLFHVVDAIRKAGNRQSVERRRPRVDDLVAAPNVNFDETPVVNFEAYDYEHIKEKEVPVVTLALPRAQNTTRHSGTISPTPSSRKTRVAGMWLFLVTEIMFRRHVLRLPDLPSCPFQRLRSCQ